MEDDNNQGDLFNEIYKEDICSKIKPVNEEKPRKNNIFEKFLLFIICVIIYSSIVYIFGYKQGQLSNSNTKPDKGKKILSGYIVVNDDNYEDKMQLSKIEANDDAGNSSIVNLETRDTKVNIGNNSIGIDKKKNYTVQLVTYKSKKYAELELKVLNKEGYQPFILKNNEYYELCIGKCESNDEAKKVLNKVVKAKGKRYIGAFTRKIKK